MPSPVFGFADLHCHATAHLGFGGHLFQEVGSGGVALGTDFNGLNQQPGPRYGPNAAFGLHDDKQRAKRQPVQQQLRRTGELNP